MNEGRGTHPIELKIVTAIGREFDRAIAARRRKAPRPAGRWGPKAVVLAVAGALLTAAGVGAATGWLPVGTVFPAGEEGLPREGEHTVVATGTAPVAGRWRMEAYTSGRLTDPEKGTVYQPTGLPCIGLRLLEPPPGTPTRGGGQCGRFRGAPGFGYSSLRVADARGRQEQLIFGRAPERAVQVELTAPGGFRQVVRTQEGPAHLNADFWLMVAPPVRGEGRLRWRAADGSTSGRPIRVPASRAWEYRPIRRPEKR